MQDFLYTPTGSLYKKVNRHSSTKYSLKLRSSNGYFHQISPTCLKLLKPSGGWTQSNEPEEHLDGVANSIKKILNPKSILAFSYKDISLALRLQARKPDIILDPEDGLIKSTPEDQIDLISVNLDKNISHNKKYDLILCRHFIEHVSCPNDVLRLLRNFCHKETLVYFEAPDCGKFIDQGNPLFLWEQHRSYFTYTSFLEYLEKNAGKIINYNSYGDSIEPCLCALLSLNENFEPLKFKESFSWESQKCDFKSYINSWKNWFSSNQNMQIVGYGIGHNFDRFLQFTASHGKFKYLIDEDKSKSGLYLANSDIPIISDVNSIGLSNLIFIMGTHDRQYLSATSSLRKQFPTAKYLSIFTKP